MIETTQIDLIQFGTSDGERIRAGYSVENNVLYIDMASYQRPEPAPRFIQTKKPTPLIWHINPDESIWSYGDRMFKTNGNVAYVDNPRKRKLYQMAVVKRLKKTLSSFVHFKRP